MEENIEAQDKIVIKKTSPLLVILLMVMVLVAGILGYLYMRSLGQIVELSARLENLEAVPSPTPAASLPEYDLPVVVYTPPLQTGEYTEEREEVKRKVVEPYIDYHQHQCESGGWGCLVSITVELRRDDEMFPYALTHVASTGGYAGQLLMQDEGELMWWVPECMGECDVSEEFLTKYPEIKERMVY